MEPVIVVFFDSDRTYVALLEPDAKGWSLAYINSTRRGLDLTFEQQDAAVVDELGELLMEIAGASYQVRVALPMESVFVHQFPAPPSDAAEDIRSLVRFEISQHFPHQDAAGFSSSVYTLAPRLDGTRMMMAVIMEQHLLTTVRSALAPLMAEIDSIEVAQLAAHNTLAYNYPDIGGSSFIVFGVQERYIDVSVVKDGEPAYYHLAPLGDGGRIGAVCEEELQRVLDEYVPFVDGAFLFGSGLTKQLFDAAASALSVPAKRLNAFRMMSTTLGERERAYCVRVAHIFPPCVGVALPSLQQGMAV